MSRWLRAAMYATALAAPPCANAEMLFIDDPVNMAEDLVPFSACIDGYMKAHNLDGQKIAEALVAKGKGEEFLGRVRRLLPPKAPLSADVANEAFTLQQRVLLGFGALGLLGKRDDVPKDRTYAAVGIGRIYMASITGGRCAPSERFVEILNRAEK